MHHLNVKRGLLFLDPLGLSDRVENVGGLYKGFTHAGNNQPTSTPWLTWGKTHKSFLDALHGSWDLKSSGILREGKRTKSSSTSRSCILFGSRQLWPLSQSPPPPPQRQTISRGRGFQLHLRYFLALSPQVISNLLSLLPASLSHNIRMKSRRFGYVLLLLQMHLSRKFRR